MKKHRVIYEFNTEYDAKKFFGLMNHLITKGHFGNLNIIVWSEEVENEIS
jgi:hypothetical protein